MTETLRSRERTKQNTITETLRRVGEISGTPGPAGTPGVGVPVGGIAGNVLTKDSGVDYDTSWQAAGGGGGSPNLDGGYPNSTYSGVSPIDGGAP